MMINLFWQTAYVDDVKMMSNRKKFGARIKRFNKLEKNI